MRDSRGSASESDDDGEHQMNGHTPPNTTPVRRLSSHPFTSILRLPGTSNVTKVNVQREEVYLGSHRAPDPDPEFGQPSDDELMNEASLAESMPEVIKKYTQKRRTAGKSSLWDDDRKSDDEGQEYVPRTLPYRTRDTQSFRVSKPSQSGPVRRNPNEGPRMTVRRFSGGGGTRLGLRSQRTVPDNQDVEMSKRGEETAGSLECRVKHMSMNDDSDSIV